MDWDSYYEKFYEWATSTQIKKMSSFVNSTFELVDFDTDDNGRVIEDIPQDQLIHEFSIFQKLIYIMKWIVE